MAIQKMVIAAPFEPGNVTAAAGANKKTDARTRASVSRDRAVARIDRQFARAAVAIPTKSTQTTNSDCGLSGVCIAPAKRRQPNTTAANPSRAVNAAADTRTSPAIGSFRESARMLAEDVFKAEPVRLAEENLD